ncbi:rhombosortase [Vibrio sp. IRLE0018]|uniref:rhombosortase n=1 Tax=Vibrio TaxID=662 RepID=UPI0015946C87|nr:rhombosortase [Vibrio floridensis]
MNLTLVLTITSVICLLLQQPLLSEWTEWHRQAINEGEWWRILSGNFTHTNYPHLLMNLAGLWVITHLFKPAWNIVLLLLIAVSILVGLANLSTDMQIYLGLSGTLHGLFAYFALTEAVNGRRSSWLLVVGVIGKVAWEHWMGASSSTSELIGARVAIEAHLSGMIAGLLLAIFSPLYQLVALKWKAIK